MLGLGDIVMPGLLLCFVMRYDAYKRAQVKDNENAFVDKSLKLFNFVSAKIKFKCDHVTF